MMPTSLGPPKEHLLPWYPAEMIMRYNTACQKAHPLCELMPNQAPDDISLSISKKKPDCELTDSICLLNDFDGLEALKCIVTKKRERHLKEIVRVSLQLTAVIVIAVAPSVQCPITPAVA